MGKFTELNKAIDGADEAVKLYDSQFGKFNKRKYSLISQME